MEASFKKRTSKTTYHLILSSSCLSVRSVLTAIRRLKRFRSESVCCN